jgi:DtxR family transcriptional regulator, Mn-dependent transcriptional regulator
VADTDLRPDLSVVTELLEVSLDRADRGEPLRRADLPVALGATEDEIAAAVDHLVAKGTLTEADGALALTEDGLAEATVVVRRHRLAERLLRDVIGLDWWKVHHEAEAWESVISAEVEAHLIDLLEDPGTCPHGNPIPGSRNRPSHPDAVRIADAPVGPVYIVRITEELETDDEALKLLEGCGFLPGRHAELKSIGDDGSVEVAGSVTDEVLSPRVAHHTFVAPR